MSWLRIGTVIGVLSWVLFLSPPIPAKAGTQAVSVVSSGTLAAGSAWVPAFAGMSGSGRGRAQPLAPQRPAEHLEERLALRVPLGLPLGMPLHGQDRGAVDLGRHRLDHAVGRAGL